VLIIGTLSEDPVRYSDLADRQIDQAVPGFERAGVDAALLQHSSPDYGAPSRAACAVLVSRELP
jgi:hypothetical protein